MQESDLCTFHGGAATTVRSNNARTASGRPTCLYSGAGGNAGFLIPYRSRRRLRILRVTPRWRAACV